MERKPLLDVIPPKKRIKQISRQEIRPPVIEDEGEEEIPIKINRRPTARSTPEISSRPTSRSTKNNKKKFFSKKLSIILGSCLLIIIIGSYISSAYSKAVIYITPKQASVSVSGAYYAKKDPKEGELLFKLMTLSKIAEVDITATSGPKVETKAKGTIVLYNNTSATQVLAKGTRLDNTKGYVYKLDSAITIPSQKKVSGKTVPGSISVKVTAEKSGAEYNIKLTDLIGDFKIIAFKGTKKETLFYGRMKTDFSGGYLGTKANITNDVLAKNKTGLEKKLSESLISEAYKSTPDGYIVFDNTIFIEYEALKQTPKEDGKVGLSVKGNVYAYIFKKDQLINTVANSEIKKLNNAKFDSPNLSELTLDVPNRKTFNYKNANTIDFTLTGIIKLVGVLPDDSMKKELAGMSLSQSPSIFSKYATISHADVVVTPIWRQSFPNSPDKISIEKKP